MNTLLLLTVLVFGSQAPATDSEILDLFHAVIETALADARAHLPAPAVPRPLLVDVGSFVTSAAIQTCAETGSHPVHVS